jgi:hypothetical protein
MFTLLAFPHLAAQMVKDGKETKKKEKPRSAGTSRPPHEISGGSISDESSLLHLTAARVA